LTRVLPGGAEHPLEIQLEQNLIRLNVMLRRFRDVQTNSRIINVLCCPRTVELIVIVGRGKRVKSISTISFQIMALW
jgi:hypothetical protein